MLSPRRFAMIAGLAGVVLAVSAGSAAAWYCEARSSSAYGWGSSVRKASARRIALANCAVRTPRGRWCRITLCR